MLLEQERYSPSLTLAMKIAGVFDTKVDDLFWLEGRQKRAILRS